MNNRISPAIANIELLDALAMVGPGWSDLLCELYDKKIDFEEEYNCNICISQIKEKWGLLRVYFVVVDINDDELLFEFQEFIDDIETKSGTICEECGSTNNVKFVKISGWTKSWCLSCYNEFLAEVK